MGELACIHVSMLTYRDGSVSPAVPNLDTCWRDATLGPTTSKEAGHEAGEPERLAEILIERCRVYV